MSDLSFAVNTQQVVLQTGLFLTNYYIVKKYFVTPFLDLRAAQNSLTGGQEAATEEMQKQVEGLEQQVNAELAKAYSLARERRETKRAESLLAQSKQLQQTKEALEQQKREASEQLQAHLSAEEAKLANASSTLFPHLLAALGVKPQ